MTPPNLLAEWARLLVGSLVSAGIRDAVVSPGSRSTPLAWAAHRHPELTVHSVFDERSAGFFALGQARATGRPSLLICTSGTAAANYFPAIVEASLAFVPVIALTADRPFEAQHSGAAQTIDQLKLYGDYCRAFFELGLPDAHPSALAGLKRIAAQTVARALSPEPGPVHLNARARKPLEPTAGETSADRELAERVDSLLAQGTTASVPASRAPSPQAIRGLADACRRAQRGLVACGPLGPGDAAGAEALAALHQTTRFPIFAEAASQYRFQGGALAAAQLDGLGFLLRTPRFVEQAAPDLLISIGATPTSSALERLIVEQPRLERHVIAPYGWPDPHGTARSVTIADIETTLRALVAELSNEPVPDSGSAWPSLCARGREIAQVARRRALQAEGLSEASATAAVVEALPEGGVLVLGNSLPIRNVDAFAAPRGGGITVLSQRGANGIDGLVAGAAGAARARGRPTLLLLGDVSLLHDIGSLALARRLETPFVVAVLDNAGGRIFEHLPVARLLRADPAAAELWLTPHDLDFEHAARLFQLRYAAPERTGEARSAVERALATPGATLVHLRVPPRSAAEIDSRILTEIERSFS